MTAERQMGYLRQLLFLALLLSLSLAASQGSADSDGDGFPDAVEITSAAERRAFREWFAAVAEAQYAAPSPRWQEIDRDCSGLIRFAFVQTLATKDAAWFSQFTNLRVPSTPPPSAPGWPLPLLSRSAFRIEPGAYREGDVEAGRIVGRATSAELMNHSATYLGREASQAQRGDMLFFAHPLAEGSGYHSMIFLGDGMVVYHTGMSPEDDGEVRLLSLATLSRHPDPSWHPVPANPHFLGFYRWRIID